MRHELPTSLPPATYLTSEEKTDLNTLKIMEILTETLPLKYEVLFLNATISVSAMQSRISYCE